MNVCRGAIARIIVLSLCTASASGQILPFHSYSVKDGLISNNINKIYQDSRGLLWIGTSDGLSVFDGRTFTNYTTNDGLGSDFVTDILEDRRSPGTMWIATFGGGVSKFVRGIFTTYSLGPGPSPNRVHVICQDHRGVLWCGTDTLIMCIENDAVLSLRHAESNVSSIVESGDSLLWFGSEQGLGWYSPLRDEFGRFDLPPNESPSVAGLMTDDTGDLWVNRWDGGVVRIRMKHVLEQRSHTPGAATFFLDDRHGNFWIGKYGGLYVLPKAHADAVSLEHYTMAEGLPENTLRTGMVDREDNLWIGGRETGIAKLVRRNIFRFSPEAFDETHQHALALSDSRDHIWAVSPEGLWEYWCRSPYAEEQWQRYLHRLNGHPFSLCYDSLNRLWVGYGEGRIERYTLQASEEGPSRLILQQVLALNLTAPGPYLNSFIVDRSGKLWCSYSYLGIVLLDPARSNPIVRIFGSSDNVPVNYITALYEDRARNIWAGSFRDGVVCLRGTDRDRGGTFHRVPPLAALRDERIWWFMSGGDGRLWIATNTGGAAIFDGDSLRFLSLRDGLLSNKINSINRDLQGNIWFGTSRGIAELTSQSPPKVKYIEEFLGSSVFSSGCTRRGLLWFLSDDGLIVYDPSVDSRETPPPPIHITRFSVNGNPVDLEQDHEFAFDQNNCEIDFIGISFRSEHGIHYRYRMSGLNDEWQPQTDHNSVIYDALRPGAYRFQVEAVSADGVVSRAPASLSFVIAPSFWMTWWFRSLVAAVVLSVGPIIYYRRIRKLKRERRAGEQFTRMLIESQETERRRIAGELHDSLGQELLVIKNRALMGLQLTENDPAVKDHFDEISSTASGVLKEVRMISQNLRPFQLDRLGLTSALESMLARIAESSLMKFTWSVENINDAVSKEFEIMIYRVAQEGANNILKHSGAANASVRIGKADGAVQIAFEDDGKGFDPGQTESREAPGQGIGLMGLRERVKMMGGSVLMDSAPGKGTLLRVKIPLKESSGGA